jgi:hypothetical protein
VSTGARPAAEAIFSQWRRRAESHTDALAPVMRLQRRHGAQVVTTISTKQLFIND